MKIIEQEDSQAQVEIGQWKISADHGIVGAPEGKTLILEPRLSRLMYVLSINANKIVSRDYLVNNVWQDTIVNEESLTRAIADLRKTLSQHFDKAIQIETIRKRGYQLNLKVGPRPLVLKFKFKKPAPYVLPLFLLILAALIWLIAF